MLLNFRYSKFQNVLFTASYTSNIEQRAQIIDVYPVYDAESHKRRISTEYTIQLYEKKTTIKNVSETALSMYVKKKLIEQKPTRSVRIKELSNLDTFDYSVRR
jgi:hypothetical protein